MAAILEYRRTFSSLGIASLALGAVGLLLFFMPVLGIPIASIGLLLGLIVVFGAILCAWPGLRWGVPGTLLCAIALSVNVLSAYAPNTAVPESPRPENWLPPLPHYVSPPAEPGMWQHN